MWRLSKCLDLFKEGRVCRRLCNHSTIDSVCGRILITGGAGFIGSAFARYALSLGSEVIVLDNLSTGQQSTFDELLDLGIHCVKGDIRDSEAVSEVLEGCQFVVHLVAKSQFQNPFKIRGNDGCECQRNTALIDQSTSITSNVSSLLPVCFCGDNQSLPLEENDAGIILSPYAESKLINEEQIIQLHSINCQTFAYVFQCLRKWAVYKIWLFSSYSNLR